MLDVSRLAVVVTLLSSLTLSAIQADARTIRVDRSIGFIPGSAFADDGRVAVDLLAGHPSEPEGLRPFSINFFGSVYDSFFLNENGVISFGAPLSAPPRDLVDVFNAGVPVIVPFFADFDVGLAAGSGAHLNTTSTETSDTNFLIWSGATYQGSTDTEQFSNWQVAFFLIDGTTNWTLELNHATVRWESGNLDGGVNGLGGIPPRIGFSDGRGRTYQVPGSGINGALLGDFDSPCPTGSLSVACNDYDFEFIGGLPHRNGVPIFANAVPEPASAALLMGALGLLALQRRRCAIARFGDTGRTLGVGSGAPGGASVRAAAGANRWLCRGARSTLESSRVVTAQGPMHTIRPRCAHQRGRNVAMVVSQAEK